MTRIAWLRGRAGGAVRYLRARLAELFPPVRCGTSPVTGVTRVLLASAMQFSSRRRNALVRLGEGAVVRVDLRTAHGRRLYAYGFCEPAAEAMLSLLDPGDLVIDCGANVGLFTCLAAAWVGAEGGVVACEPSPATMELLRDNVDLNGFGWVDLREVALAGEPGRLRLQVFDPGSGFSSFAPEDAGGASEVDVEVTTIDKLAGDLLARIKLVKLDVEGAELRALQGASRLIERARPDFIVELEPEHLERQSSSIDEVQALFEAAGYAGYAITEGGLAPLHGAWRRPLGDPNIAVRPRERAES